MEILGRDFEPPLFSGSGYIHIVSRTRIEFVMHATPRDEKEAFKRLVQAAKNPYDIRDQFRVLATEYDGTEWNGGWTAIQLGDTSANVWRLSGSIRSLVTSVSGDGVCPESSVEVVYDSKLRIPTPMNMVTSVRRGDDEVLLARGRGSKKIDVAGTEIEFFHGSQRDVVWGTARTSHAFRHPYAENWISEPLCLLLGQLVFPRLVARNLGNSNATIWLRPSPPLNANTLTASILGEDPYAAHDRFWGEYKKILTMIVNAKDAAGDPNFESHPLTQYYHEIAQASTGSTWVLCMTLASAVEGVAKLLFSDEERKSDFHPSELQRLREYIKAWEGDESLRARILGSLTQAETKGIVQSLKKLAADGAINKEQIDTWKSVRNQVMHGTLVAPWMDQESESRLRRLIELTHRLSATYIHKCVSSAQERERETRPSN